MKSSVPAAAAVSTISRPIHLTPQHGNSSAALILSSTAYPNKSIEITREALSTLRWFMQYAFYNATRGQGLSFRTRPDKLVPVPQDILMNIFYFSFGDIARFFTRQCTVPVQCLIPGEQEELEGLALSLRLASPKITQPNLFFFDYKLGHLSNASLNADFETVKRIVEKTNPDNLRILLSTETTAIITHLGIERTGTPLQMALYSHDEAMFKILSCKMDPAEVQRQCKVIFDRYKVADYNGLIKELEADANRLCGELGAVFSLASATDITNALNRVPGTTSALQDALHRFNINLDRCVRANPVHNPYILQRLFEIYDQLPYDWNTECLISQQAIGLAQKLSSMQWLQHYAQGIYYLGKESGAEAPGREFSRRGSSPAVDIRSSSVLSRLGVDSCIDIFGPRHGVLGRNAAGPDRGSRVFRRGAQGWADVPLRPAPFIKTFVEQNQRAWKLMQPAPLQHAEHRCVVQ